MKKTQIRNHYEYWYFENQLEFFACLEEMLEDGYEITDSIHLCVELTKETNSYLLSYIEVDPVDENIKETLKLMEKEQKVVYPDYDHCILNTISSIRKAYHGKIDYETDEQMDAILKEKNYKNIVIMLLDGMGENILEKHLPKDSFLKQHHVYTNTAIYPSTTAASTTATINGKAPIRTAWLGWENYFREIKRNIVLFKGTDFFTDEPTGFNAYQALPYEPFYADLHVNGSIHQPNFSKENYPFHKVLKNSLKNFKKKKINMQYVYFTQPDSLLHEFGTDAEEVTEVLKSLDDEILWYTSKLPKDTLLIISADHGHTDVSPIHIYACETIQKMLKRKPSNDSRCITFRVKDEYRSVFPEIFTKLFGYAYEIYPSSVAIDREFFGKKTDVPCSRSYDFLADYVAVAKKDYNFNYKNETDFNFKSHHAGITADEMLVPVIIFRK